MNLEFKTIGKLTQAGIPCLVQRAQLDPRESRQFWIVWRTCQDMRLKASISLRKEEGVWCCYRTVPEAPDVKLPPMPMPYTLKSTDKLLPYQPAAVARLTRALIDHGVALDGSDTGLGKTYSALATIREVGLRPGIICKKAGIATWKRACDYMNISPLFIVNWEQARTGNFPYAPRTHHEYEPRYVYHWKKVPGMAIIFDELHLACNHATQNHDLWRGSEGIPSIYLSATLADRPSRLGSLIEMLRICSRAQFLQWLLRRGNFVRRGDDMENLEAISSVQDMQEVHKLLYPRYGVRLSYTDAAVRRYFPRVVHQIELISLDKAETAAQNRAYEAMIAKVREYRRMGAGQADIMVAELRFRQAAELLKTAVLVDMVTEYVAAGLSVVVFVNFRETLAALAKALKTRSLIYGSQEVHGLDREAIIADFQSAKSRVLLSMISAGGASISLHDLIGGHQRVSLICPTYNPIDLKQVMGRTYRAGSKTTPIIKLVYAADTVEEKVAASVRQKLKSIDALNKGDLIGPELFTSTTLSNPSLEAE